MNPFGPWSPFWSELPHLPNAWSHCPAEQQCEDRPYDYLPELELVLEWARKQGGPVLDLACGNGRLSLALAREGFPVVGLDLNAGFIRRAREEAARLDPETAVRVRFEVGDARDFTLPERFPLVVMADQSFKYLLRHDDHLDCLQCVRDHLVEDGRFLVEHRCLFRIPDPGTEEPYTFTQRGAEWIGIDSYDPILQLGVSAFQPAEDAGGDAPASAEVEPCRDFTYQELSLLHRVVGFELESAVTDLDQREPPVTYFDATFVLKKVDPWRPRRR